MIHEFFYETFHQSKTEPHCRVVEMVVAVMAEENQ